MVKPESEYLNPGDVYHWIIYSLWIPAINFCACMTGLFLSFFPPTVTPTAKKVLEDLVPL